MESFAEEYYSSGRVDMSMFVPKLDVKMRDMLCFKGKKIDYDAFTKCVKRGSSYVPLVAVSGKLKDDDRVIDLFPLINVGVAEYLTLLSCSTDSATARYLSWCEELELTEDYMELLEKLGDMLDVSVQQDKYMGLMECLRSSIVDYRFPLIKRIYSALNVLRLVNPKSYCTAIIEAMKVAYSAITIVLHDDPDMSTNRTSVGALPKNESFYRQAMFERWPRCGALEYELSGGKTRKITDGRGAGIGYFAIFIIDIFKRFADFSTCMEIIPVRSPESRARAEGIFQSCLGDDYVGRYLRNGRCRVMPCDEATATMGSEANVRAVDCQNLVDVDGFSMGRGLYEAQLLYKYAIGAKELESPGVVPPMDCTYGTRLDVLRESITFCFSDRGMRMKRDVLHKQFEEVVDEVMQNMNADAILDGYRSDIFDKAQEQIKEAFHRAESAEAALEQVTAQRDKTESVLAEKLEIISQLREEVKSLEAKVSSIYSDEDAEEEVGVVDETPVSEQEMLDFVNQFRLVVVGGHENIESALKRAGFNNFYIIDSVRASGTTKVVGDFFCICAKFVAHKVVYSVETLYNDQLDQFFYFNGTNMGVLLRTAYQFMKRWFESEEEV